MNLKGILFFMLILCISHFSFAQKKDKWVCINGKVVDTNGVAIPNQCIKLFNKSRSEGAIRNYSQANGSFSFKVKRKFIKQYSIETNYSTFKFQRVDLEQFLFANNTLVLNINVEYYNTNEDLSIDVSRFNYFTASGCNFTGHGNRMNLKFNITRSLKDLYEDIQYIR